MLSNETLRKLREMRLGVMAEAFSAQLEDSQFQAVSFEDRFAMLVDAEWKSPAILFRKVLQGNDFKASKALLE